MSNVGRGPSPTGAWGGEVQPCTQRRRFVPRAFYMVDDAADDRADRHVVGIEVTAGWW